SRAGWSGCGSDIEEPLLTAAPAEFAAPGAGASGGRSSSCAKYASYPPLVSAAEASPLVVGARFISPSSHPALERQPVRAVSNQLLPGRSSARVLIPLCRAARSPGRKVLCIRPSNATL